MSSQIPIRAANEFILRSERQVDLGPLRVAIRSNEERFSGLRYFSRSSQPTASCPPHYTLYLCRTTVDGPWDEHALRESMDKSYRAGRFAAGYYITDHFGDPAYLVTRGATIWVYAKNLEPILWPFLVKLLLTQYSMSRNLLHLKAAAVEIGEAGTLLVAHGGGGKTVLLTQLCRAGARFVSNTHTLINDCTASGVATSMRVRDDALFGPIIAERRLTPGWKRGEFILEPGADLGWQERFATPLRNICLVDFRGSTNHTIQTIDREVLFDYMDQFSLALNVYGLKEDILDHLHGNVQEFASCVRLMRQMLRALIENCNCYYLNCDCMDLRGLERIYRALENRDDRTR
jgi:hypothetical protein